MDSKKEVGFPSLSLTSSGSRRIRSQEWTIERGGATKRSDHGGQACHGLGRLGIDVVFFF